MPSNDLVYDETVGIITRVIFGILSPERIKEKSVCEIYKHITSQKNLEGTLSDPRLGPIERGLICPTCKQTYKDCPGHFGHLNLAKPIIQIQFYAIIIKLLSCWCRRCSSILIDKYDDRVMNELRNKKGKGRYLYVLANALKDCPNCGATQPKYTKDKEGIARINVVYGDKKTGTDKNELKETINPETILFQFKNVSDEDVELVGLNPKLSRPEWMIATNMLVPPAAMRPSVRSETGKVSDDDLTHKLNDIIKFNNQLRIKMAEPTKQSYIDDWWQLVQYHHATYIDNEISNIPTATHRSGRPLKTIRQRVKAKEGRVRGNLMGKRVDDSARSVITGDPNLSLDELGVPRVIAMNLTWPEIVGPYNIIEMTQLVRNGPDQHPGAKSYKKLHDTNKKNLRFHEKRDEIKLEYGDIVYRHLMNGDIVLFNRQPSLHKMSMMAHRVRVLPYLSFRINANVTAPYNADFDGDEMNMHVPKSYETVNELKYLALVPTQVISPQASSPVMGMVQDTMLGGYLFTKGVTLNLQQIYHLIGCTNAYGGQIPTPSIVGANPRWTSQQMISMFLPQINYSRSNILIKDGEMTRGLLDKAALGAKNGSLFHVTWNDYGPMSTLDLFNNLSFVIHSWLQMSGFSVGVSDCVIPSTDAMAKVRTIVSQAKQEALQKIEAVNLGTSEKGSDPQTIKKEFPRKMIEILNMCRGKAEKISREHLDPNNSINTMVTSGSKGNASNIVQLVSLLGQQEVEGSWITEQYHRRTLPHFPKDSLSPESHGFIENSYMSGLSPSEYWFHATAGRVGVISKAIKTAETGYIQRRLIKALEDLRVCYDRTVRNANNMIIQTKYGHDGFDSTYHETQKLPFLNFNMAKLLKEYKHLPSEDFTTMLSNNAYEEFNLTSDRIQILDSEFNKINEYHTYLKNNIYNKSIPESVKCPINMQRNITNIANKFKLSEEKVADINPIYIVKQVIELRRRLKVDENQTINYLSTLILNSLIATHLSSKNLIKMKFTKLAFDHLIETIYNNFIKVLVTPGENVGILSAQSIGEPATQMTLDAFHSTGLGSKANVSRGVPRLRELLGLTRNPKAPVMMVQINDSYFSTELTPSSNTNNYRKAEKIAAEMEYTTLQDLLLKTEIIYDEDDHQTCISDDQEFIDSYYDLLPQIDSTTDMSRCPWLIRMEFNREQIMNKHIPLTLVENRLKQFLKAYNIEHTVILSDVNAQKLISRIKIENDSLTVGQDPINYMRSLEKNLLTIEIKGINGIDKGFVRAVNKDIVLPDGTTISPFDLEYDEAKKSYNHLRYVIDTNGSNLIDVLNLPNVDGSETISNNVWEIYRIYGIEAARNCLIHEIVEVLEYSGSSISLRHIDLLVDVMTSQGTLVSVDRHGVNKTDSGPLHRASFEETTAQITTASIFNEEDKLTGVSGNIMFGQFVPTGSNAFRIGLDIEKIKHLKPIEPDIIKPVHETTVTDVSATTQNHCEPEDFSFTFKLNTKL